MLITALQDHMIQICSGITCGIECSLESSCTKTTYGNLSAFANGLFHEDFALTIEEKSS